MGKKTKRERVISCSLCNTEILPDEPTVRGTKDDTLFHDDCYLRAKGVPEEAIDDISVVQDRTGRVTAFHHKNAGEPDES